MKLSRCWGIPYCELIERIDEQEIWRQQAFDELMPIEDTWLQTCWLLEAMEGFASKKPMPAYKRYPGDMYKNVIQKPKIINRSKHMKRVAEILNKTSGE